MRVLCYRWLIAKRLASKLTIRNKYKSNLVFYICILVQSAIRSYYYKMHTVCKTSVYAEIK